MTVDLPDPGLPLTQLKVCENVARVEVRRWFNRISK